MLNDKIDKETKASLRNKISALESRIAKRLELNTLKEKLLVRRNRFTELANILSEAQCRGCSGIIQTVLNRYGEQS